MTGDPQSASPNYTYGSIIEVEDESAQPLIVGPQTAPSQDVDVDAYPEANDEQRELLILMDAVICEASTVQAHIARISLQHIETKQSKAIQANSTASLRTSFFGFLCSSIFGAPLLTLVLTIGVSTAGIVWIPEEEWLNTWIHYGLPGVTAFLGFLGCWKPIVSRLFNFSQEVYSFASPACTKQVAVEGVDNLVMSVASQVDHVNMKLSLVVDDLRNEFTRAVHQIDRLRKVDPHLPEIPTIGPVEQDLQAGKEELRSSVLQLKTDGSFDATQWIPPYLSSSESYCHRASSRALVWCFLLQIIAALGSWYALETYLPPAMEEEATVSVALLGPLSDRFTTTLLCWILILAGEAYVLSAIQIGIVYFSTTAPSATVGIINQLRTSVSQETNHLLKQHGILFLCRDILELRLERVKSNLTDWIHQSYKLDMLYSILDYDTTSTAPTSPSRYSISSPSNSSSGSFSSPTSSVGSPGKWSNAYRNWRTSGKKKEPPPADTTTTTIEGR
jgi:hypothetical protein